MNIRQKTLAALLVLGIGMSGCNTNDNNLIPQIVNKKTDENKTEGNRTVPTSPGENNESNGTIPTPPVENNESNRTDPNPHDEVIIPVLPKQMFMNNALETLLEKIGNQHNNGESNITIKDLKTLKEKTTILNINDNYVNIYRSYIASADTNISSPATRDEVQQMITQVKNLNLPEHAILDRSFFKKTNGVFEHRFVYLAVESNTTGRKWLNNNLGADYANVDSSDYNPSQQATAIKDLLANGSLFQWGRKADGHELIEWSDLSGKYATTATKSDNPDDSLLITGSDDWRVDSDDTLWASESSPNNVCPVGYRLPLNPNGANDGENEWYQETKDLTQNIGGLFHSFLKVSTTGIRKGNASIKWSDGGSSNYWFGSVRSDGKALNMGSNWGVLVASDYGAKIEAHPVRCIKDQTPAERSNSILSEIGKEHRSHNSIVTVAQLKAITPALENINAEYENIYRTYIASVDKSFSLPATRDEVQSMIDEVNDFNLPEHAILDRSFFKKTNGAFEHRFVYLAVKNSTTGRTWLNNNLGADYANVDSSNYNASQQATASTDYLAYGSMFQWGRKADAHELMDWTSAAAGTRKYGETDTTNDNPSDSLFITRYSDWRATPDDTLWASESSPNNVCPIGYRLPLNPNGAVDAENELAVELNSWDSKDAEGSMSSALKLPTAGGLTSSGAITWWTPGYGIYWTGSVVPSNGNSSAVSDARDIYFGNALGLLDTSGRGIGYSVRCIKDQTPTERSNSILSEIGKEHRSHNSIVTVAQLKAITPEVRGINNDYEKWYQGYIEATDTNIGSPATREEVQHMIDEVNSFNLPDNAILDKNFYKKTHNKFEHRFVYLPVTNSNTGRTWLNNNLGADYANLNSSDYNPSQQATAGNDHLAYGSLFQWGRKADGHELINWTGNKNGTKKYGHTQTKSNDPSNSLYIIGSNDWRVTSDDTLWASKSSKNSVCPVGYRLPLDPNRADDGENEWYQEIQTWSSKNPSGAINSVLKLPMSGFSYHVSNDDIGEIGNEASYWFGSANGSTAKSLDFYPNNVYSNANSVKTYGFNVRCIKDQTPAERSVSILKEIGNEHSNHKSTVTVAQLRAITPALNHINDNYENIYRTYIANSSDNFSSPATRDEVQRMVDAVNISEAILARIAQDHHNTSSTITVEDLRSITPTLNNIDDDNIQDYRNYIASADSSFSSPATTREVQRMIDAANLNLQKVGSYNTAGFAIGVTLSSDGTKAYVADEANGLVILNISNPSHPIKIGSYNTAGYARVVTLSSNGTKAYVADDDNGLVIVNISDPAHPTKLGSYNTAGVAWDVALSNDGTKAYVADEGNGLVILNISNPSHPTKIGSYNTAGYSKGITLSNDGTKAYVADDHVGLVIINISDPSHPTKLGTYNTSGLTIGVTLSSDGSKAYVADWSNGLVIVDISDPAHPTKLGSYNTAGYSQTVTLSSDGTKAYVADEENGLVIVDISDPAHPTKFRLYDIAGLTLDVTLSSDGSKAYIADAENGLVIVGGIK